jgi:hypothetical protein
MSFGSTKLLAASGGKAYEIDQSLMFEVADSSYLSKTPSSASNQRTWTLSTWIKNTSENYAGGSIWGSHDNSTQSDAGYGWLGLYQDKLQMGGWSTNWRTTNRVFRDVGAWMHLVVAVDTTIADGSADNRIRIYINGVEETSFSEKNNPSQNYDLPWNKNQQHRFGAINRSTAYYFGGYFAETQVIDGSQLTPSSFGETDEDTGQWIPKEPSGLTYGTNGFYLKFESGAIGTDSSGNGNNYTANNLANADVVLDTPTNNFCTYNSLDNGSTVLSQGNLKFVNSSGGSDTGCTMQIPFTGKWYWEIRATAVDAMYYGITRTSYTGTDGSYGSDGRTILYNGTFWNGSSAASYGSSYSDGDIVNVAFDCDNSKLYFGKNGTWFNSGNPATGSNPAGSVTASEAWVPNMYGNSGTQNDINFGQNGTFNGLVTAQGNADGSGEGDFYYSPPSGFKALCSKNLPTPAIKKSTEHFNTVLYTGNNSTNHDISGVGFQPDFTWIKNRSQADSHVLHDAVRGVGNVVYSDLNLAENNNAAYFGPFQTDGFRLSPTSVGHAYNASSENYVAWAWKVGGTAPSKTYAVKVVSDSGNKYRFDDYGTSAVTLNLQEGGTYTFDQSDSSNSGHPLRFSTTSDGSHGGGSEYTTGVTTNGTPGSSGAYTRITVAASAATLYYYCTAHSGMGGQANTNSTFGATNLDGSILSVVSENTTSGFSIVSYTGTGSNATVGHELGVAPSVIILKNRDTDDNWRVYSRNDATDYLALNATIASTDDNTSWNDTAPTSSVFTIGTDTNTNRSGDDFVAYCFAEIEGFSKFGTYTGNGNANGPYIITGFQPAWIMTKIVSTTVSGGGDWVIYDDKRDVDNVTNNALYANLSIAESTGFDYDINSNGFKARAAGNDINQNAQTFLYLAFSEFPFKYANAR